MTRYASLLSKFTRKELQKLFSSTVMRFKQGGLDIRFSPTKKPYGRLLVVIPKRTGSAPLRNRLKRRLKAIFYEKKWYETPVDISITAYPEATRLSFDDLAALLATAFGHYHKKFPYTHDSRNPTDARHL